MANKLILKKSSVAAKVPLATDLEVGELAVNLIDKKLYSKNAAGTVVNVGNVVDSVAGKTGAVTLVKGDVGLGNVDNTADASKPVSTAQQTAINLKANLASPTFTGVPAAPTAAVGTNTTQLATTAYVNAEIANDAAPIAHVGAGGTAHAAASTSVAGFMSAADKTKLDGVAAGAQVNTVTSVAGRTGAVTIAVADVSGAAPLATPTFTGTPAAPTAAVGTNTTQLATTAYVNAEIANDAPTKTGGGASGTWGISVTGSAASVPFSGVTSKPTTLSGYGITDALQGGAGGAIIENSQSITANYTLTAGKNGISAGAITIASGITVTVPSGATWVIV